MADHQILVGCQKHIVWIQKTTRCAQMELTKRGGEQRYGYFESPGRGQRASIYHIHYETHEPVTVCPLDFTVYPYSSNE